MSIINNLLVEGFVADVTDLEALREAAIERCHELADSMNTYYSHALDNLSIHREHEPEPSEVAELLGPDDLGDWRKAMTVAAFIATREFLGSQVNEDVDSLEVAVQEAEERGYHVVGIHASCIHGWAAHASESDWDTGVLHHWKALEGEFDADLLRVDVSEGQALWLDLKPAE